MEPFRLTPENLHPVIFAALDRYQLQFTVGGGVAQGGSERLDAFMEHQRVWWREYGSRLIMAIVGSSLAFIGAVMWVKHDKNPWSVGLLMAVMFGSVGLFTRMYYQNRRIATAEELAALLPVLELDDVARSYAQAVLAVCRSGALGRQDRDRLLQDLSRVVDEHETIRRREAEIGQLNQLEKVNALRGEVDRLAKKVETAQDTEARATYAQAVESTQRQLAKLERCRPLLERMDAQRELILRTLREATDTFSESDSVRARLLEQDTIRSSISVIHAQTAALEEAYAELN